jgi:hypothetical protein
VKKLTLALAAIAAAVLTTAAATAPRPSTYTIPGNAVFPEGIAYQEGTDRFYVGSTTDGTIFRGKLPRRPMSSFLPGGADGRTTALGMKVGSPERLFIAGGGTGAVWVYDTKTRRLIRKFESGFAGQQFLNDLVIAKSGDVFVTDSNRPVLYRIPAAAVVRSASPGALEAWLDFTSTTLVYEAGFNLNGIVATQDGKYLVVVQSNTGKLFRIEIATKTVAPIDLAGQPVMGDGLWLRGRTLFAVARPSIVKIRLSGGLGSGEVISRTSPGSLAFPTTLAIARGRMLVVNSQFDKRAGSPVLPFTVSSIEVP